MPLKLSLRLASGGRGGSKPGPGPGEPLTAAIQQVSVFCLSPSTQQIMVECLIENIVEMEGERKKELSWH